MATHARLNASGASRWMNCPGAPRAEDAIPRDQWQGSPAAREGTAAHLLGETCLREQRDAEHYLGRLIAVPIDEADHPDPFWTEPGEAELLTGCDVYRVDEDMAGAVQVYVDHVRAQLEEFAASEPRLVLERRYDLSWVHPGMFGTSDAVVDEPFGTLCVTDYKHGRGVPVYIGTERDPNPQVMYYAAGAAHDAGWAHERVRLSIVQPRCPEVPDVQTVEIPIEQLKRWAETTLRDAARLTEDEDPIRVAGDHCRWCRAQHVCPEARDRVMAITRSDFAGAVRELPVPADADGLARAMAWLPMIDAWCKAVASEAQRRLERGEPVPGYKLVRKKSNRRFLDKVIEDGKEVVLDDEAIAKRLMKAIGRGVKKADLFVTKLKSPAQIEKLGKKAKEAVAQLTYKPEGGLTIAPESDPRSAVEPAAIEFAGLRAEDDAAD